MQRPGCIPPAGATAVADCIVADAAHTDEAVTAFAILSGSVISFFCTDTAIDIRSQFARVHKAPKVRSYCTPGFFEALSIWLFEKRAATQCVNHHADWQDRLLDEKTEAHTKW
mmetsp:Transcript_46424/g.92120  ORF Transcript_46424/g.92120 Transcript_46424/m.92120 type:complete len:113 (+) Transcript_46424:195-533(+)